MAVVAGRVVMDKKYFSKLFQIGALRRVDLLEAPFKPGKWEMMLVTTQDKELQVETARGETKIFSSLEAARQFAEDIGFKKMELSW